VPFGQVYGHFIIILVINDKPLTTNQVFEHLLRSIYIELVLKLEIPF